MGFEPRIAVSHHPGGGAELGFERVRVVCRNLGDEGPVKCLNDLKLL
jgi:hypothetical protein